jgi:hypothetical protein
MEHRTKEPSGSPDVVVKDEIIIFRTDVRALDHPADVPTNVHELLDQALAQTLRTVDRDYGLLPAVTAGRRDLARILLRMVVLAERATLKGDIITVRTRSDGDRAFILVRDDRQGPPGACSGSTVRRDAREEMLDIPDEGESEKIVAAYGGVMALSEEKGYRATLTIPIHPRLVPEVDVRQRETIIAQWTP